MKLNKKTKEVVPEPKSVQIRVKPENRKKIKALAGRQDTQLQWMADLVVEKGLEALKKK